MRPPRALAAIAAVVVITAGAVLGIRALRLSPLGGRSAAAATVPAAARFHPRLLSAAGGFIPAVVTASPAPVTAAGGILVDLDSGAILWRQDDHRRLSPASTTKILTALVVLENLDPGRMVTITADALHQAPDETRMGLLAGERLSVRELLTGMLLVSGNDAATALAVDTVGLGPFVAAMNAQVAALGLRDSHFTTPVGLEDPGQYTSAYDLAVMSAAAERHFPLFAQTVALRTATLPATAGHPEFDLTSINLLLSMYAPAVGIKPGWTGDAGYCEVGMAVRDGHRLISVLLNAPYDFSQSRRLLDWGFQQEGLPSTLPPPSPAR